MQIVHSVSVGLVVLAVTTGTSLAAMHLRLTNSLPQKDQTITESPPAIRVWFNEDVSLAVSRLELAGPLGAVKLSRVEETDDPKSFKAAIGEPLELGSYTVTWRTAGPDGHIQRGEFAFAVAGADRR